MSDGQGSVKGKEKMLTNFYKKIFFRTSIAIEEKFAKSIFKTFTKWQGQPLVGDLGPRPLCPPPPKYGPVT